MATYQKRAQKRSNKDHFNKDSKGSSATAEVFEALDSSASKTESIVAKYQNHILTVVGSIVIITLSYLGYNKLIVEPQSNEAVSELNQAQYYFEIALNSSNSDSLYRRALNGGEGRYGFLDIIENYKGTPAAKLATYSAGMAYLNIKDYNNAILYLDQFSADDVLLSALSKGAIGDAFAQLDQKEDAFDYYVKAAQINNNMFSTPKYLYKAAMMGASIGKIKQALTFLKRIEKEFLESTEAELVGVQIGKLETLLK